ncbi:MAG: aminotransferase class V-fold PLP-dependent enzyme [Planctomycetota bacterium]
MNTDTIDMERIRSRFPALASNTVFLENAGGSQVPEVVARRMHEYMLNSYVQLDAGYALSSAATEMVHEAHDFINLFMNGTRSGKVAFGPSCSVLCRMLADCYGGILSPGDEIVVAETGHEANTGPWMNLKRMGVEVRLWKMDPRTFSCPLKSLERMLNARTRVLAFPHVSNLLGGIEEIEAATRLAHKHGARVVVDGVAYAPHRAMDVEAWDVDWYVYSTYKVYGPHMAVLYGKHEAYAELTGPNHYFIPDDEIPYKFELGGASHEGCRGLLALGEYLNFLAGRAAHETMNRETIVRAFDIMKQCESKPQARLIRYLIDHPRVRIIGPESASEERVATISFVHEELPSKRIAQAAHDHNIGIRNGHMYAHRLCKALNLDPDDGVVRVSLVHYNTIEEIDRLIEVLDKVL